MIKTWLLRMCSCAPAHVHLRMRCAGTHAQLHNLTQFLATLMDDGAPPFDSLAGRKHAGDELGGSEVVCSSRPVQLTPIEETDAFNFLD
jgi:hypothetical protein